MVALTKLLIVHPIKDSLFEIEQFVEDISKNVFINEIYYGNLLTSLSQLYSFLKMKEHKEPIEFHYTTDYKHLKIEIIGMNQLLINQLTKKMDIRDTDLDDKASTIFTIQNLTDNMIYSKERNSLALIYDISSVHDKIYNERKKLLLAYLKKVVNQEPAKNI